MTITKLETNIYPLNVIAKVNELVDGINGAGITVDSALSTTSTNPVQNKVINTALGNKENTINKVTSLSSSSTNAQYPSAKCVYDLIGNVETLLQAV